jgi:hypothetical protein
MPSLSSLLHHFIASHPGDGIFMLSLVNNIYHHQFESEDHGWIYSDCFADLDGHRLEIMFTDQTQIQQ